MNPFFRSTLACALVLGAIATVALACVSGGGSGNIGDVCQSIGDCNNQYECLPIQPDGGCSKPLPDGGIVMTCQQTCTSECNSLAGNYTCTMGACGAPDIAGICRMSP